jgi:ATP adenylyltransferase
MQSEILLCSVDSLHYNCVMREEHLKIVWAPWRQSYVAAAKPPRNDEPCFLCQGLQSRDDRQNLVVLRTPLSVVVLNRYPYNSGHLLVAPAAHKGHLNELRAEALIDTMQTLTRMVEELGKLLHPDGFNVGLNLGRAAGAGLPGHLHWHIVPRWEGDTNFMPVVGDTKVIAQSLNSLYDLLVDEMGRAAPPKG